MGAATSDEATKKFANAKAISSDMFFGDQDGVSVMIFHMMGDLLNIVVTYFQNLRISRFISNPL